MFQLSVPGQNINTYMNKIRDIPILSAEEEYDLAVRYKTMNDVHAAQQLVLSHLRYVVFLARKFSGYSNIAVADLIQQGNYGLMVAVQKFDPFKGIRLTTFAVSRIKSEMLQFIISNWRIIKVATTKAQRKLFFNLRKMSCNERWLTDYEARKIANELNVPEHDVREMESRLYVHDSSFDPVSIEEQDDDASSQNPIDYLADDSNSIENTLIDPQAHSVKISKLQFALTQLNERDQFIVKQRFLNEDHKPTLIELAKHLNVSAERVRQLEGKILQKLHNLIVES